MLRGSQAATGLVEGNGTSLRLFYIYKVFLHFLTIVQKKHIRKNYSTENLYDLPRDSVPRPLILGLVKHNRWRGAENTAGFTETIYRR